MNVKVGNRLASGSTIVDTNVVARWREFLVDVSLCLFKQVEESLTLGIGQFKERCEVALRKNQGVAYRDREAVSNDRPVLVGCDDSFGRQEAKRAFGHDLSV